MAVPEQEVKNPHLQTEAKQSNPEVRRCFKLSKSAPSGICPPASPRPPRTAHPWGPSTQIPEPIALLLEQSRKCTARERVWGADTSQTVLGPRVHPERRKQIVRKALDHRPSVFIKIPPPPVIQGGHLFSPSLCIHLSNSQLHGTMRGYGTRLHPAHPHS